MSVLFWAPTTHHFQRHKGVAHQMKFDMLTEVCRRQIHAHIYSVVLQLKFLYIFFHYFLLFLLRFSDLNWIFLFNFHRILYARIFAIQMHHFCSLICFQRRKKTSKNIKESKHIVRWILVHRWHTPKTLFVAYI